MGTGDIIANAMIEGIKNAIPNAIIQTIKALFPCMLPCGIYVVAKKILWKLRTNKFM